MTSGRASRGGDADQPLSPELVLVDPELARSARERLSTPTLQLRKLSNSDRPAPADAVPTALVPTAATGSPAPEASPAANRLPALTMKQRPRHPFVWILVVAALIGGVIFVISMAHHGADVAVAPQTVAPGPSHTVASVAPSVHRVRPRAKPLSRTAASKSAVAATPQTEAAAKRFVWVPSRRATYYEVEFFRGGAKIFHTRVRRAALTLPASWTYHGRRYALTRGHYRWLVRPGFGRSVNAHLGNAIVRSGLVVP